MAEKEVKLFGNWASTFTVRVEWALKLKGIEYEFVNENIPFNKSEELLRLNPVTKKIPVLVHNGKPLAESLVILEYIDDTWTEGYSIMPKDPYDRAQARFWAKFADDKCISAMSGVSTSLGEAQQKMLQEAREVFQTLEQALGSKQFFGGDQIGYLDLAIGLFAFWMPILEEIVNVSVVDNENAPLLKEWFARILDVDMIKTSLPPRDKMYELSKQRREQFLSGEISRLN
ncbi:Glutathione S-transferase [Rhynchospora pubera]|uniref:glutathione transferase n=1 Tax=Rhynchospora pubera TaxID=906938 RepID=A0AAV8G7R7_9POAL|nr:Glutathione S-transferase [Rhynchospora pubera]